MEVTNYLLTGMILQVGAHNSTYFWVNHLFQGIDLSRWARGENDRSI